MSRHRNEIRAYRGHANSQKIRKPISKTKNSGKIKASKEMNHHSSGCRKALQQSTKNKMPVIIFRVRKRRFVNVRRDAIRALKLQIFLFSRPPEDFFFFAGQKAKALLVNFIQNLIDSFLGDNRNFFVG